MSEDKKIDIEGENPQAEAPKGPEAEDNAVKSAVEKAMAEVTADEPKSEESAIEESKPAEEPTVTKAEEKVEAKPQAEPEKTAEEPAPVPKHDSFDDDGLNIPKVGKPSVEETEAKKPEEPEIPRPMPVSEKPKKRKSSGLLIALCVMAAAACCGIGYIAHQNSTNRAMSESVSTMANAMKLEIAQDIPSIVTKNGLTYNTKTGNAIMDQIPDQLKPYIISAPSEGTLEIKNLNSLLMSGDHTITFVLSNTDEYGQSVTNSYDMLVHVKSGQMDPSATATASADASADPSANPSADPSASADATATPEPTPGEVGDIVVINPTPTPTTTPAPTPNTYLAPDGSGETISEIYDAPAPYNETNGGASTGGSDSHSGSYQNVGPADWSN